MSTAEDLGKLIMALNPYTNRGNSVSGTVTGDMDLYVDSPAAGKTAPDISQIEIEVDTAYPAEWEFKEEAQHINTAIRIRYRYPVKDSAGKVLYYIDDYLLVGYEGTGGP
jgi:hypothetical protein